MAEVGQAVVALIPSARGFGARLNQSIGGDIDKSGQSAGRRFAASMGGAMRAAAKGGMIAVGAAAGASVIGGFKSAVNQQNAQKVFAGLYGSTSKATTMMNDLRKVASGSAIDYEAYTKAGQSLAYAGIQGKDAVGILKNVGKAIVAAGGDSTQMQSAMGGVMKAVNNGGIAMMDSLSMISESGVPILSGLGKKFGKSTDQIKKMASSGKITIQDVMDVMQKGTGKTFQDMIKAGDAADKSFGNTFKRIKDNVVTSIGTAMVPVLNKAAPVLEKFGGWLEKSIPAGMSKMSSAAKTAVPYVKEMAFTLFKGQIDPNGPFTAGSPVIAGLLKIRGALVTAGSAVKGVLLKAFQLLRPHLVTFGQQMAGLWPDVKALASAVGGFLKGAFQGILPILKVVGFVLGAVFVVALKLIPPVLKVVIKALTWLINLLKPFAGIIASTLLPLGLLRNGALALFKGLGFLVTRIPFVGKLFGGLGKAAGLLWSAIKIAWFNIRVAFLLLRTSAKTAGTVLNTVFRTIGKWATWLYAKAIRPAFTWIKTRIGAVATWVRDVAGKVFSATFGRIGAAARALYTRGIKPAFQWITTRIGAVYRWFRDTVGASFSKTFGRIGSAAKSLYTGGIRPAFQWITKRIGSVYRWFRDTVAASFKRTLSLISGAFTATKDAIGKTWSKIKGAIHGPIKWVWGKIKGFIGLLNKIPGVNIKIGASSSKAKTTKRSSMPGRELPARASGGTIPGPWRGPTADNVLGVSSKGVPVARVNPREYIHPVDAVKHYGTRAMDLVRQKKAAILPATSVPTYATGGQVGSYFGSLPRYAKGGMTWPLIWSYVRKHFPGVRKTSDYRPGSQSLRKSSHALGTAIDIGGSRSAISKVMTHMASKFGRNMRDLIYSPLWGHKMISDGRWINTPGFLYRTHFDHGHIGLLPGRGLSGGPVSGMPAGGGFDLESLLAPAKKFASNIWQGVKSKFGWGFGPQAVVGPAKEAVSGMLSKAGSMASAAMDSGALGAMPGPLGGISALLKRFGGKGKVQSEVKKIAAGYGWGSGRQWAALANIISRESSWDPGAKNPRSSARGLFQKMTSIHGPIEGSVAGQARWGLNYIRGRYGSPLAAWAHWQRHRSYADGGLVKPIPGYAKGGVTKPGLSLVGERGPELMYTPGGSRVYSNAESKRMVGETHFHVTINGVDTDRADEVVKALRFEFNRNGRYVGV